MMSTFTFNNLLSIFSQRLSAPGTQNIYVSICSQHPCSTGPGSSHRCYICTWSALGRSHQLPFLSLPFVASPIICLHEGFWSICALLFATIKKEKGTTESCAVLVNSASVSEALSPFANVIASLSRWSSALKQYVYSVLKWHMKSQGHYRHAGGFGKWIFEKLLNTTFYLCECINSFSKNELETTKKPNKKQNKMMHYRNWDPDKVEHNEIRLLDLLELTRGCWPYLLENQRASQNICYFAAFSDAQTWTRTQTTPDLFIYFKSKILCQIS